MGNTVNLATYIYSKIGEAISAFHAEYQNSWNFGYFDYEIQTVETALSEAMANFLDPAHRANLSTVRTAWRGYTAVIKRKIKEEALMPDLTLLRRSEMLLERAKFELNLAKDGLQEVDFKINEIYLCKDAIDQLLGKIRAEYAKIPKAKQG